MNTNIASLYEFTLQQMAAESYFEGIGLTDTDKIREALRLGTNRLGYPPGAGEGNTGLNEGYPGYTRMTTQQADEFLDKFKIVHQWSDNPTPTGRRPLPEGIDGKPIKLAPGMNITAEIKTGQRRVIEYLLSPIQRAGSESLRER